MAGATTPGAGTNYERNTNVNAGGLGQPFVAGSSSTGTRLEQWTLAGSVRGPLTQTETQSLTEKNMIATADPVPLGLVGFAAATFTVSTILAGWFGIEGIIAAVPVLIVFGGVAQFLAGMWSYARGNLLGTVAFGSFGSFNVAFGMLLWMNQAHFLGLALAKGDTNVSLVSGVFVLMFAWIAASLAFAALKDNLMIAAILAFLAFAYLCDGVGLWIGGNNWITAIGGYSGIVSSILAFYTAAAIVVNSIRGAEAWPIFQVKR